MSQIYSAYFISSLALHGTITLLLLHFKPVIFKDLIFFSQKFLIELINQFTIGTI